MADSRTKRQAPTDSAFPSVVENLLTSIRGLFVYGEWETHHSHNVYSRWDGYSKWGGYAKLGVL